MRLSARILENVSNVNSFDYVQQTEFMEGDAPTLHLQLVDLNKHRSDQGFSPAGQRYVPDVGATLQVVLECIDAARQVTRFATQPFATDASIWAVQLMSTDQVRGTVNLKLTLTEGTRITRSYVNAAVNVSVMDGMTRV